MKKVSKFCIHVVYFWRPGHICMHVHVCLYSVLCALTVKMWWGVEDVKPKCDIYFIVPTNSHIYSCPTCTWCT